MRDIILPDRAFVKQALSLAIPVALQFLIMSFLAILDNMMIGQLGEAQFAAVSLANQLTFVHILIIFGTCSGASTFMAQFYGAKDSIGFKRVTGVTLIIACFVAIIFSLLSILIPDKVMSVFTNDGQLVIYGSLFLSKAWPALLLGSVTMVFSTALRSIERVRLPLLASTIALALNTILNYLLIFGKFGFPKLGIEGSAIATVIARFVEVVIILIAVYLGKNKWTATRFRDIMGLNMDFLKRFFIIAAPVILNESLWGMGTAGYNIIIGRMGTVATAAFNAAGSMERIAIAFLQGLSNAAVVLVGSEIGAGNFEKAERSGKRIAFWGFTGGVISGILMFISANGYINTFFNALSIETKQQAILTIFTISIFFAFKGFNLINIVGVLRSGGDTLYAFTVDTVGIWLISLPLGYIAGIVFGLPLYLVYGIMLLEEMIKAIISYFRLISLKWIKRLT